MQVNLLTQVLFVNMNLNHKPYIISKLKIIV